VPDGTYSLDVPPGTIDFNQRQTQLNLVGGFLTRPRFGGGSMAFVLNLPLIQQSRTVSAVQPAGAVSPSTAIPLVGLLGNGADAQVQTAVAAFNASNNTEGSGFGDVELSTVWLRNLDRLKLAASASLVVPTVKYDPKRSINPGFGDFHTLRPGAALTYALGPDEGASSWSRGVTLSGRVAFGISITNQGTQYRSGNFGICSPSPPAKIVPSPTCG
jgi:hypothetical protein